jgi:hypothetical protein
MEKLINSEYFLINSFKVFSSKNSWASYFKWMDTLVPLPKVLPSGSFLIEKELAADEVQIY